ncbi:response regulator transcription factor [Alicyclobacillus kakegawensis]|uniref:response regulator transcription factor n=1 Tax=Alicyclobacillus kakegawensis TaxID=392012 RepID=UPI000B02ABEB|nr:response regulator transcription factor [Alicyclobacillus kakegawensis]
MGNTPLQAQKLLIVDDEPAIVKLVEFNCQRAGFETESVTDGRTAYERVVTDPGRYDLVVLDVMLPGMDGMEVCRRLRQQQVVVPIILLTARDEELDRVLGLEIGADDYVTKPFSPRELVARIKAVLRRGELAAEAGQTEDAPRLSADGLVVDVVRHEATLDGEGLTLTPKEFELLRYLMEHRDRVLTRDQLLDQVWGYWTSADTRIVDVHVSHLREKIEQDPKHPRFIHTVRGVGYKFSPREA